MSVMVGSVTESLAPDEDFLQAENATVDEEARDAARVQLAATLSVLVGLFQVRSSQEYVFPTPHCCQPHPHPHLPVPLSLTIAALLTIAVHSCPLDSTCPGLCSNCPEGLCLP